MTGVVPLQGACLYVPAIHPALPRVLAGTAVPGLRVAVVCLEDGLAAGNVPEAMQRVRAECRARPNTRLHVYVRPRDPAMLQELLSWPECSSWHGFVLPKVTVRNAADWLLPLAGTSFSVMPILETKDVFDPFLIRDLCDTLAEPAWSGQIEVVRIGGADLFAALGTRRPRGRTIYDSILGPTVRLVASQLMARDMYVSAPVCEALASTAELAREVAMDVEAGFVGKTAIHPRQVSVINDAFRVHAVELQEAQLLLGSGEEVFQFRGTMCERAPHGRWAQRIIARESVFGTHAEELGEGDYDAWTEQSHGGTARGEHTSTPDSVAAEVSPPHRTSRGRVGGGLLRRLSPDGCRRRRQG